MARILVVDDEAAVRLMVIHALELDGHQIEQAADGNEALARFPVFRPQIVVTDILMPNKEGIETMVELRKLDKAVKIVAMSGGGRTRNLSFLDLARKFGADSVINKPFGLDQIRDTVRGVLAEPERPAGG